MLYQEKSGDPACFFQLRALPLQADRGRAEEHHLQRVQDRPLGLRQLPHHIHTAAQGTVFKICKKMLKIYLPGTDIMILKIFSPKNLAKILPFCCSKYC
jgi:hypothetical protein